MLNRALLLTVASVLYVTVAHADETVIVNQNFDKQVAGELPEGWVHAWGNQDDDLFRVSSENAASLKNSLEIDRESGSNLNHWGLKRDFTAPNQGMTEISFNICIVGPGSQVGLYIELRDRRATNKEALLLTCAFYKLKGGIYSHTANKPGLEFGRYVAGKWYHLSMNLPGNRQVGDQVLVSWEPLDKSVPAVTGTFAYRFPEHHLGTLRIKQLEQS